MHLAGFLDDMGINVADLEPSNMDIDMAAFNNIELSPIEDHARSLDMYYVPRSKVGPQDRRRKRGKEQKMLREDRALYEPQTETMDIVSQFQQFGQLGSNSDSSNQEESPRKAPRLDTPGNAFGSMFSNFSEDDPAPLGSNYPWPLDDPPFGTLTPMVPTLNLSFVNSKPEPKSLPFVNEPVNTVPPRPSGSCLPVPSPRVRTTSTRAKPVRQQTPEDTAINNMLATFGKDQPNDVEIARAIEKQRRKRRHALTERSRTRSLSSKIKLLGEKLNSSGIICKMEKLPILTTAVDYVYTMQSRISEKRHKQAQLRAKLALLQERVSAARVVPVIESGSLEYAQIYRHKPFPTAIIDSQYKILECNDRFLSMVNNSKDQVLNHSLTAALSENPPELEQLFSYCENLLSGKIQKESRPCLAALLQGSHYYAVINQLDKSHLQLSFMKASNARRIPGINISSTW